MQCIMNDFQEFQNLISSLPRVDVIQRLKELRALTGYFAPSPL